MAGEHTCFRKHKQVLEDKLVSAELSLRYWAQQENFCAWVSIPVSERVTPELLRGREQALIQTLQPPHFPFIARWFCPRKRIIKPPDATFARKTGMFRLWRKKRRKQALQHAAAESRGLPAPLYAIFDKPAFKTKEATWVLLTQLGSNTLQHFEAAKRLGSNEFSFAALCALHRLAKHLPAYMAPWHEGPLPAPCNSGATWRPSLNPKPLNSSPGTPVRLPNFVDVGSTEKSAMAREHTRFRKYKQVLEDKLVSGLGIHTCLRTCYSRPPQRP